MFIEVGKRVSVEDLLLGMIVQSGNDASIALAEHVAGSESVFAEIMNQYAAALGMLSSNFVNVTGLPDENHYSTARDLSILARAIIGEFPEYYQWYSVKEFTFNDIKQPNRNNLLWRDSSVDGMKTGHTDAAGYCLVSSAEREGMRVISVVLGTSSAKARIAQTALSVGNEAVQLHGAIGFTDEHALHHLTRRLWSWRAEFGGASHWAEMLGRAVAARGADALWPWITAR